MVVGDFQGHSFAGTQLGGFFLQEEPADHDADPNTSEGIFVSAPSAPEVAVGDVVSVTGVAAEASGKTQIGNVTGVVIVGADPGAALATPVSLPVTAQSDWEKYEGMLVAFAQDLYISEFFNFDRFNEIVLSTDRQYQGTHSAEPGPAANAVAAANALARITFDDGRSSQNPDPAIHPNGEEFTLTNTFRGGDILQEVTGVLDFAFGLYRIQPTQGATHVVANPRPTAPDPIAGNIRVASSNVLNFFTHLDDGSTTSAVPPRTSSVAAPTTPRSFSVSWTSWWPGSSPSTPTSSVYRRSRTTSIQPKSTGTVPTTPYSRWLRR